MNTHPTNNPQRISFRDWMYEKYLPFYDPENPRHADYDGGEEYVVLAHDMDRAHCPVDSDHLMDYVDHIAHNIGRVDPLIYGVLVKAFMQYRTEMELQKVVEKDLCVLGCLLNSEDGVELAHLWAGDWKWMYDTQSEADQALCNHLAHWTKGDTAQMDRLFRHSGLMRKKWDEGRNGTYGEATIRVAIACLEARNAV